MKIIYKKNNENTVENVNEWEASKQRYNELLSERSKEGTISEITLMTVISESAVDVTLPPLIEDLPQEEDEFYKEESEPEEIEEEE